MYHLRRRLSLFYHQCTWSELSGALGDLGTFIPLLVGLVREIGLDLGTTLIATGLYNVITGLQFGIPMPVQPMKTIAAVALSEESLTIPEMTSAGLTVSCVVFILGITRGMTIFNKLVPFSLVRGIQLGVGLKLAVKGIKMVFYHPHSADWRDFTGPEGLIIGFFGLIFILLTTLPPRAARQDSEIRTRVVDWFVRSKKRWSLKQNEDLEKAEEVSLEEQTNQVTNTTTSQIADPVLSQVTNAAMPQIADPVLSQVTNTSAPQIADSVLPQVADSGNDSVVAPRRQYRIPAALLLVILGIILLFSYHPDIVHSLDLGTDAPKTVVPTWSEFKEGFYRAGLPQIPLTTLNSVVAVCKLSEELFPENAAIPTHVATSVGAMNIIGAWFGVMPCCHGAGGLAAQVKFGAKTGTAPVLLGLAKIILGLVFGSSLFKLLHQFPPPLLGSMLVFSGIELAASCRSETEMRGVCLMLMTAAGNLATGNTGIGFLIGLSAYLLIQLYDLIMDVL
eukprot:g4301.t1